MIELLFGVLVEALKLANTKESNKTLDRVMKLREEWLAEYNKPRAQRSNKDLDEIEAELQIISKTFIELRSKK